MPKEGSDNFMNVWTMTLSNSIQQGAQSFTTYEIDGVARNDAGSPMFKSVAVPEMATITSMRKGVARPSKNPSDHVLANAGKPGAMTPLPNSTPAPYD
jgi:hypothetical protein